MLDTKVRKAYKEDEGTRNMENNEVEKMMRWVKNQAPEGTFPSEIDECESLHEIVVSASMWVDEMSCETPDGPGWYDCFDATKRAYEKRIVELAEESEWEVGSISWSDFECSIEISPA